MLREDQGVGVGGAQDLLEVGEGALEQGDSLVQPPGVPVGVSEVVAGGQGVGVGVAEDLLAFGDQGFAVVDGLAETVAEVDGGNGAKTRSSTRVWVRAVSCRRDGERGARSRP